VSIARLAANLPPVRLVARSYGGFPSIAGLTTITPGILLSRSSGTTPAAVMASASPTTADAGTPYRDLEYSWTCNAPRELIWNPFVGGSVDIHQTQTGPEAAFLFRTAGTYTITLTARGWNGSAYVTASTSTTVTVTDWTGTTKYVDPGAGSGGTGDSPASPYNSPSALTTWMGANTSYRRAFIKAGTNWPTTNLQYSTANNNRIGVYGGTGRVKLGKLTVQAGRGWGPRNNVCEGVDFTVDSEGYLTGGGTDPWGPIDDLTFINCRFTKQQFIFDTAGTRCTWWNCEWARGNVAGQGLQCKGYDWYAVVGGYFGGGMGDLTLEHHVYPTVNRHSLFRCVDTRACTQLSFALNTNCPLDDDTIYSLISDCRWSGTMNGHDWSNSSNTKNQGAFDLAISQRNLIEPHPSMGTQGFCVYAESIKRADVRDSRFILPRQSAVAIGGDPRRDVRIYRNYVRMGSANAAFSTGSGITEQDNTIVRG
jgi:hypothetical protein